MEKQQLSLLGAVGFALLYLIWLYAQFHAILSPEPKGFTIVAYIIMGLFMVGFGKMSFDLLKSEYKKYLDEMIIERERKTANELLEKELEKQRKNDI